MIGIDAFFVKVVVEEPIRKRLLLGLLQIKDRFADLPTEKLVLLDVVIESRARIDAVSILLDRF